MGDCLCLPCLPHLGEYKYTLRGDPATVKRRFRTLPSSAAPEPPAAGAVTDARFPFALGVIGDLGQTADSQDTIRILGKKEPKEVRADNYS